MEREFSNLLMASPTREISGGERSTGRESIAGKMGTRTGGILRRTAGVGLEFTNGRMAAASGGSGERTG